MNTINKAFILGASGYIGQYLCTRLLERGIETSALVNNTPLKENRITRFSGGLQNFDWTQLESRPPNVIFHSARLSGKNQKSRQKAAAENRQGNERLLSWLKSLSSPPIFVFVSGTLVYGSQGSNPVDESYPPSPISFQREYFEAEKPVLQAMKDSGLPIIIARPSWIYGPGSWLRAFYLNPAKSYGVIPLYGKGNNLMTFIHVKDMAGLMLHLAINGKPGNIYNIGMQPALKQKEFVGILAKLSQKNVKRKSLLRLKLRNNKALAEAFSFSLDVRSRHQEMIDAYQPFFPDLEAGLRHVLQDEGMISDD